MKKIKKFVCMLLAVCFSVTAFPHTFVSAETSSACPFELGDTIKICYQCKKNNKPTTKYMCASTNDECSFYTSGSFNEFEVIDTFDDGSFCLGFTWGSDYNLFSYILRRIFHEKIYN